MATPSIPLNPQARYRVDKFVVPEESLTAFESKMRDIESRVRGFPGCIGAVLLKQVAGAGRFNLVRVIAWEDEAAAAAAVTTMQQWFAAEAFDPQQFARELGVETDLALYAAI